jgi:hypothetical protein
MNDTLNTLIEKAQMECNANRCPIAETTINGKIVFAYIVQQYRRTTLRAKQKSSVMWKVNGKRVAAKDLMATLAN